VSDLPKRIEVHEEGPREGFQFEKAIFPLQERVALVDALGETGLREIQVASFVDPNRVPQMADAAEFFGAIRKRSGVRHTGLWLNARGFERALATPGVDIVGRLYLYASEAFSQQNGRVTRAQARQVQANWLKLYEAAGAPVDAAYVMTAFGCNLEGAVPVSAVLEEIRWIANLFGTAGRPLPALYLADTVGWATPLGVERVIGAVREALPEARIGLHLHDTRGAAPANFYAALRLGVTLFDASVGGLGGCPFAGHAHGAAAGNICTEDLVFMAHEMGVETGVDLESLIEAARLAEKIVGRPLPGHVMHSGPVPRR
jgi:isopropylmalate/homocitrate/citramalate synthase